jgi:hypothetical protein
VAPRITVSPSVWRAVGISLCAALVVAAVLFDVLGPKTNTNQSRLATAAVSSAPKVGAALDPPASARPTATASPRSTDKTTPSPTSTPAIGPGGPGVTEPGIDLRLSPRVDGNLDVVEHLVLRTPASTLDFVTPDRRLAGDAFARAKPSASGLQADSGGQPIYDLPSGQVNDRATMRLGVTTRTVNLRYRLDGTSVVSIPSSAGRALAFIRPLTAGVDPSLPVQVHVGGAGVLNLTCPQLPPERLGCAEGSAPTLFVTGLTAATSTVIVQINLPEP